ncbi:MAG TPA: RNA polymerase sigma factor region1.1 domain-containing protein, partial [Verrucomicrobiae bacterium]|nr:RNA polymerase sigma factor region1.1 domain-containing protein [Verrucomicrobiae bacterium]
MSKSKARKPEAKGDRLEEKVSKSIAINGAPRASDKPVPMSLPEKIKELVRLAQEQGQVTYNDISEIVPETETAIEILDE